MKTITYSNSHTMTVSLEENGTMGQKNKRQWKKKWQVSVLRKAFLENLYWTKEQVENLATAIKLSTAYDYKWRWDKRMQ